MSDELKSRFESAIENDSAAAKLDEVTARDCASDNYNGTQYNFFGTFVPIRPIIDVVAQTDGKRIEEIHHTNDGDHVCLGVFIADFPPETEHPAFV